MAALLERIEWAGPDVAIDDAQRAERSGERQSRTAGKVRAGFAVMALHP